MKNHHGTEISSLHAHARIQRSALRISIQLTHGDNADKDTGTGVDTWPQ